MRDLSMLWYVMITKYRLFHAQSGMARDCGEYKYVMNLNGRPVERTGYACQKYNGTWEVVPHPSMYQ